jgi:hypothetical protein
VIGFYIEGGKIENIPAGAIVSTVESEGMCLVRWDGREVWVQFRDIHQNSVVEGEVG